MYRTYYRSADGRKSGFSPSDEDAQIRLGETLLSIIGGFGQVVAEDLGALPEFLRPSLARLGLPGYRVLALGEDRCVARRQERNPVARPSGRGPRSR